MVRKLIVSIVIGLLWIPGYCQVAFIGSEGFGSVTRGAYGNGSEPKILIVDDLRDASVQTSETSGTLRWCLGQNYPRIILFNTSGIIELGSEIRIGSPYLSLFGQSAPYPGITIRGASFYIRTHDIIIQHIKVRVGDGPIGADPRIRDGLSISDNSYNIIVDHCSFSWGIDENIDIWGVGIYNVTISNCIIAEGLYNSSGYTGAHSYGMLVGENVKNLSLVKNLFVNNLNRNPFIKAFTEAEIINCLIYNSDKPGIDTEQAKVSIIGSVIKRGPESGFYADYIGRIRSDCSSNCEFHEIYVRDNIFRSTIETGIINEASYEAIVSEPPVSSGKCAVLAASSVEQHLVANCGAFYFDRDNTDKRYISNLINTSGSYVHSPSEVGGYGDLPANKRNILNHTGFPAAPHQDNNGNGFNNLEEWLQVLPLSGEAVVENVTDLGDADNNSNNDGVEPGFLFPNPSEGIFTVLLDAEQTAEIFVCDLFGKTVYHQNVVFGSRLEVDLSFLLSGTYLFTIITPEKVLSQKAIII